MSDRASQARDRDLTDIPYTPDQLSYVESLSDGELLHLIGVRYEEVKSAESLVITLRESLRSLVLYVYKARPDISIAELSRRTGLKQTSIYETYLGDGRNKRRKKP